MKEIRYLIPSRYMKDAPKKPIMVKAWETAVKGLIAQSPILRSRGRVHLTHKASGAALVWLMKNRAAAAIAATKLKKLPIDWTCYTPSGLYRQLAKLNDRQIATFREAVGHKGPMLFGLWRSYCENIAAKFDELYGTGKGKTPAANAKRSQGGKLWKGKNRTKSRQGRQNRKQRPSTN